MEEKKFLCGSDYVYIKQLKKLSKEKIIEKELKRRKKSGRVILVILVIFIIGLVYGGVVIYKVMYQPMEESRDKWKSAIFEASKYFCNEINETYFNTQVYTDGNEFMVYCSKHNVLIRDGERV